MLGSFRKQIAGPCSSRLVEQAQFPRRASLSLSLSLHSSSFVIVLILNFFIFFSCRVAPAISPPAGNNRLNISVSTNINKKLALFLSLFLFLSFFLSLLVHCERKLNRGYLQFGSFFFIFAFQSVFFLFIRRRKRELCWSIEICSRSSRFEKRKSLIW